MENKQQSPDRSTHNENKDKNINFNIIYNVDHFRLYIESMKETVEDPVIPYEIEEKLKTQEDWDYWNKVKKNNKDAIITIKDP